MKTTSLRATRKAKLRQLAVAGAVLPVTLLLLLLLHSLWMPLPQALTAAPPYGKRILDRDGQLLARTMATDQVFRDPVSMDQLGDHVTAALLAAEDKRFYSHGGIDLLAIARAAGQAAYQGRFVSGASTITQQLARSTFARPRTLWGKWQEMALALCIERHLDKNEILEHYLNRVHFGPNIVGVAAAADHFFGKPLVALSVAEAATLVGLVRGPSLYDPRARPKLTRVRRDRVLERMVAGGSLDRATADVAIASPLQLLPRPPLAGAHHWVREIARRNESDFVRTTLVGPLQNQVQTLVAEHAYQLSEHAVSAASVVIVDNDTGDILTWVGSPHFSNQRSGGQNDGVLALRQPGSTLKPFLYALAIEELGFTTASRLSDVPTAFRTQDSFYSPRNFDRKFRGNVTLHHALANSLNVPAVAVAQRLGIAHVLARLREFGLSSLDLDATHYGPALALGDGEVTLLELVSAYAVLARGGLTLKPRFALSEPTPAPRRVLTNESTALISEVLMDDAARRDAFGAHNALDLPFPVAVKTGTSKGYRDAWTVGYTRGITVGVWVGNFDGAPTRRMTGARGAGPLFHQIMQATQQILGKRVTAPGTTRPLHDVPLVQRPVCQDPVPPTSAVTHQSNTARTAARSTAQTGPGAEHSACPGGERSVLYWFTREQAGMLSDTRHPRAPESERLMVQFPVDGMVFHHDPAIPANRQRLVLRAAGPQEPLTLVLNERPLATHDGRAEWELQPGQYRLLAQNADRQQSEPIEFTVRHSAAQ